MYEVYYELKNIRKTGINLENSRRRLFS